MRSWNRCICGDAGRCLQLQALPAGSLGTHTCAPSPHFPSLCQWQPGTSKSCFGQTQSAAVHPCLPLNWLSVDFLPCHGKSAQLRSPVGIKATRNTPALIRSGDSWCLKSRIGMCLPSGLQRSVTPLKTVLLARHRISGCSERLPPHFWAPGGGGEPLVCLALSAMGAWDPGTAFRWVLGRDW